MSKITRTNQKVFASSSSNIGQVGSLRAGTKVLTSDLATIQALSAFTDGFENIIKTDSLLLSQEELNALFYLLTSQISYGFQEGIPEYESSTTYYQYGIVKKSGSVELYMSLTNDNVGNLLTDGTNWKFLVDLADMEQAQPAYVPYSVNSGAVDADGYADFIDKVSDTEISFDVSVPVVCTYPDGMVETNVSLANITGLSDNGTYAIIKEKGQASVATLATITEDIKAPTSPDSGDYWLNIGVKPYQPKKYNGASWVDTQFVKMGEVTKAGGTLGTPISYAFNGVFIKNDIAIPTSNNSTTDIPVNIGSLYAASLDLICVNANNGYAAGQIALNVTNSDSVSGITSYPPFQAKNTKILGLLFREGWSFSAANSYRQAIAVTITVNNTDWKARVIARRIF